MTRNIVHLALDRAGALLQQADQMVATSPDRAAGPRKLAYAYMAWARTVIDITAGDYAPGGERNDPPLAD